MKIKLAKKVYKELINITEPESCGFLGAKEDIFEKVFEVKNKSKNPTKFKMAFFSKIKALIQIVKGRYKKLIIYHVHKYNPYPSYEDISNSVRDIFYLIIYKKALYFYYFKVDKNHFLVDTIAYEVVEDK